jgi:membrane associated rhomboid family serine protease
MGLSDRHYNQAEGDGRGPSWNYDGVRGLSRLPSGAWSVNTWIIVINVAVFVLMVTIGLSMPTPVTVRAFAFPGVNAQVYPALLRPNGEVVKDGERLKYGESYYRTAFDVEKSVILADASTGRPVVAEQVLAVDPFTAYGHFSTALGFGKLQVWRLVTFQFLHAGILHLFFNMLGLYIFGPPVEAHLGRKKYLAFYLVCGIFGGLAYLALNLAGLVATQMGLGSFPGFLIDDPHTTLVGASAGVFGVIMACARLRPTEKVQLIFPPVEVKMKYFAIAYVAIAAVNLLFGGHNAGGDAAHIGGALAGFYFILRPHLLTDFFDVFTDSRRTKSKPLATTLPRTSRIDELLAKVAKEGRQSLSAEERETLHRESERLRTRDDLERSA